MNIYYAWDLPTSDALINEVMLNSAAHLTQVAVSEGQDVSDVSLYPNYAIYDTTVSRMYSSNLPTLQALKAQYDPDNVMGLAGGWKF